MHCRADIERMADIKLEEAICLLANKFWDAAYYLAGYSVELLLKARICKLLEMDDFFTFRNYTSKDLYKPFKVHDYDQLAILGGIYPEIYSTKEDSDLAMHWSVIWDWDENSRYFIEKSEAEANKFINSIKEISKWIKEKL